MNINSDKINLLIAERGKTQKEFANEIGLSRQWLGIVLQRGSAAPAIIVKMAKGLNVDADTIIK